MSTGQEGAACGRQLGVGGGGVPRPSDHSLPEERGTLLVDEFAESIFQHIGQACCIRGLYFRADKLTNLQRDESPCLWFTPALPSRHGRREVLLPPGPFLQPQALPSGKCAWLAWMDFPI